MLFGFWLRLAKEEIHECVSANKNSVVTRKENIDF